ncbi:hypothetical protein [Alteromonas sp. a30]|uniref:hypothetical protein n=1 Tax=Alteromonas sp. a30 TaxID=2730917 RepID=UPI00227EB8A9|nr:hypothetical protein [Alteromonas sp. a30]MCY7296286.1 hypothetical protein [Alteromonas sp. a30]
MLAFHANSKTLQEQILADKNIQQPMTRGKESAADFTQRLKQIIELAEQGSWQEILTIAAYFDARSADSLDYILFQSISHNAPLSVVKRLLQQGATLQPHFINILAQKNNVKLAKKLVPLGLDLHGADLFGRNALHHVLTDFQSKEMFDYLLSKNVAVDAKMGDKDPLYLALKRALTHQDAVYYINALIGKGAPILDAHNTLLEQIRHDNPRVYQSISLPSSINSRN